MLQFFGSRIASVKFDPKGESIREFAGLLRRFGRGESACMVYCRDNHDVLGSSNLRDSKLPRIDISQYHCEVEI